MENELKDFVEIIGHNGYYYINKEGKIYSFYINDYLKFSLTDENGYFITNLVLKNKNKRKQFYFVHRLVAEHFIPKIEGMSLVNHLDGNKQNNNVTNLEWTDHIGNALHAHATGLHPKKKNVNEYVYYQLDDDKKVIFTYYSISEINDKLNVKYDKNLREIMKNNDENTKVLGYYWRREKIDPNIQNDEIWKPANVGNNIDDFVEVSNYGKVYNKITGHYYVATTGKCSKYYKVTIKCGNKKYSYPLHRLVAFSFLENNCGPDAHVDHIDKNPSNNHLSNLQWMTIKDHMKKDKGISVTQVSDDGTINVYDMIQDAAEEIGCNSGQISEAIAKGKRYKDSYWYRTNEYYEELHEEKIEELNLINVEKEETKKLKKKKRNYTKENEKRKEKIKLNKENLRKKIIASDSNNSD
jgi:hypothetical protein